MKGYHSTAALFSIDVAVEERVERFCEWDLDTKSFGPLSKHPGSPYAFSDHVHLIKRLFEIQTGSKFFTHGPIPSMW